MGFHVITDTRSDQPTSLYFESLDEMLLYNDIPADSIVYQGEATWKPARLHEHAILKDYVDANKRVGRRAEIKFEQLALANNFIVQRIDQDQKSYQRYVKIIGGNPKRSDYLIMNLANIEVDVKCLTSYNIGNALYHYMNKSDIDRHIEILNKVNRRLVFAVFERAKDWYRNETLKMITLEDILRCDLIEKDGALSYLIPQAQMTPDFNLLHEYRISCPPPIVIESRVIRTSYQAPVLVKKAKSKKFIYASILIFGGYLYFSNQGDLKVASQDVKVVKKAEQMGQHKHQKTTQVKIGDLAQYYMRN